MAYDWPKFGRSDLLQEHPALAGDSSMNTLITMPSVRYEHTPNQTDGKKAMADMLTTFDSLQGTL